MVHPFFYLTDNVVRHKSLYSMEQKVQMSYGFGTIKVGATVVATTFKTKVAKYNNTSFAYIAFRQVAKESNGLIRIDENGCKNPNYAMVTAVATGAQMLELSRLVNQAKILQLECQLAHHKCEPFPEWAWVNPIEETIDDLPF